MLLKVDDKGQVIIPAEIVEKLKLKEEDYMSVSIREGGLFLCPMLVCPRTDIEKIASMVKDLEKLSKDPDSYYGISKMFSDMGV